jgi:DNA-binding transcriptional MerR regulator
MVTRMVDEDDVFDDGMDDTLPSEPGRVRPRKTADAFRTISEVADDLHVPQHVLRFWETKFPQVRPLKRGGGRRYYRPEDLLLLRRVADLLYTQGYTIKGVQRLLRDGGGALHENIPPASAEERSQAQAERLAVPVPAAPVVAAKKPAGDKIPQLSMPGLLMPEPPRSGPKIKSESETERLRGLLTETLHALEELRRMIG